MSVSDQEMLHHVSRMPFVETGELAMFTGEAHVAIRRVSADLLSDGKRNPAPEARRRLIRDLGVDDFHRLPIVASTPMS